MRRKKGATATPKGAPPKTARSAGLPLGWEPEVFQAVPELLELVLGGLLSTELAIRLTGHARGRLDIWRSSWKLFCNTSPTNHSSPNQKKIEPVSIVAACTNYTNQKLRCAIAGKTAISRQKQTCCRATKVSFNVLPSLRKTHVKSANPVLALRISLCTFPMHASPHFTAYFPYAVELCRTQRLYRKNPSQCFRGKKKENTSQYTHNNKKTSTNQSKQTNNEQAKQTQTSQHKSKREISKQMKQNKAEEHQNNQNKPTRKQQRKQTQTQRH